MVQVHELRVGLYGSGGLWGLHCARPWWTICHASNESPTIRPLRNYASLGFFAKKAVRDILPEAL